MRLEPAREESGAAASRDAGGRGAVGIALGVAILSVLLWYVVLLSARPALMGDEGYHVPAIRALARELPPLRALLRGDWGPGRILQMPPTYHLLASLPARLVGSDLWMLRGFNVLFAVASIVLLHTAARAYHANYGPSHLLRYAWNPLLLPLWALVYTDLAALVGILLALHFQVRRRLTWAAVGLAGACLIRQSNLVWVAFFMAWGLRTLWCARPAASPRAALRMFLLRHVTTTFLPHLLMFALALGYFVCSGGLATTLREENRPHVNITQFYIFGLTAAVLWVPVWLPQFARLWPRRVEPLLARAWICAAAVGVIGLLELAFRNPHPWNLDPDYLRNWLLAGMTTHTWVRYLVAVCLVLFVPTLVHSTHASPARGPLTLLWVFALLFLLGHYLIDPRYYVVPLVLADFLTPLPARSARHLVGWYLLLTLGVAAFIVTQPGGAQGIL